jgi:CTP synthase (UTP-ammonia lyase)
VGVKHYKRTKTQKSNYKRTKTQKHTTKQSKQKREKLSLFCSEWIRGVSIFLDVNEMTAELFRIREEILPYQIIEKYEEGRLEAMVQKCPVQIQRVRELNQRVIELMSDYDDKCDVYESSLSTCEERCLFTESRQAVEIRYYTLKDESYLIGYCKTAYTQITQTQ